MAVAVTAGSHSEPSFTPAYSIVPSEAKDRKMATRKPQSPMRLVTNAFLPADALASSVNQNAIRKYEQAPTPSQPMKVTSRLLPRTSMSIEKTNRFM